MEEWTHLGTPAGILAAIVVAVATILRRIYPPHIAEGKEAPKNGTHDCLRRDDIKELYTRIAALEREDSKHTEQLQSASKAVDLLFSLVRNVQSALDQIIGRMTANQPEQNRSKE